MKAFRWLKRDKQAQANEKAIVYVLSVECAVSDTRDTFFADYFDRHGIGVLRSQKWNEGARTRYVYTVVLPDAISSASLVDKLARVSGILAVRIHTDYGILRKTLIEI